MSCGVNFLTFGFLFLSHVFVIVFSAVSMVSSFEADDDTHDLDGVGERN